MRGSSSTPPRRHAVPRPLLVSDLEKRSRSDLVSRQRAGAVATSMSSHAEIPRPSNPFARDAGQRSTDRSSRLYEDARYGLDIVATEPSSLVRATLNCSL